MQNSKPSKFLFISIIILFTISCKEKKNQVKNELNKKISTQINTIDSLKTYSLDGGFIKRNKEKNLRIVTYIDATCGSCIFDLDRWNDFIQENKFKNVGYLFYMRTYSIPQLQNFLKEINFKYPVIVDFKNTYKNVNNLSEAKLYQTFLIDGKDKIILVGNPIYNNAISNLYLKTISERIKK